MSQVEVDEAEIQKRLGKVNMHFIKRQRRGTRRGPKCTGSSGGKTGSLLAYVSAWSLVFMDTPYLRYSRSVSWMTLTCLKRLTEQKKIRNIFV